MVNDGMSLVVVEDGLSLSTRSLNIIKLVCRVL